MKEKTVLEESLKQMNKSGKDELINLSEQQEDQLLPMKKRKTKLFYLYLWS